MSLEQFNNMGSDSTTTTTTTTATTTTTITTTTTQNTVSLPENSDTKSKGNVILHFKS